MSLRETIAKAADKKSKREAGYSKGKPQAHCGICRHFEAPHSCEIVAGKIEPAMWCRFFEKAKQ